MSIQNDQQERGESLEGAAYRELRFLEEVEENPLVSQRRLASKLGVALGVANLLVRSLAKKGYIRATRVGWKRWVYAVTPAGFARKAHLTIAYVERFSQHYRRVRTLIQHDLWSHTLNAESRIAIYGTTELAELTYLALRDMGIVEIDVYDQNGRHQQFLGMRVRELDSFDPGDYAKVMVAFYTDVDARRQELQDRGIPPSQIVTLLGNSHE